LIIYNLLISIKRKRGLFTAQVGRVTGYYNILRIYLSVFFKHVS